MTRTWRLGTRGSELAVAQSSLVAAALQDVLGAPVSLVTISTRGDRVTDRPLSQVGGKGLFTKEIEHALLQGDVDFAVHSMKDMPSDSPEGLVVPGVPMREDPRDVLVGGSLETLPAGATVGTGSARRRLQILARRPDLEVVGIRGNVGTRLAKQTSGEVDAVVLAAAGLKRLDMDVWRGQAVSVDVMVPAVGQGALAVQCREDDAEAVAAIRALHDPATGAAVACERAFMAALQGGCSVPAACHAVVHGERMTVRTFFGNEHGDWATESFTVPVDQAEEAGRAVAARLRARIRT